MTALIALALWIVGMTAAWYLGRWQERRRKK